MKEFENFPDLLTVNDLQRALRIGRSKAYTLVKNNEIRSLRIGRSVRIPKKYLIDFVQKKCYNDVAQTGSCDEKGGIV